MLVAAVAVGSSLQCAESATAHRFFHNVFSGQQSLSVPPSIAYEAIKIVTRLLIAI